MILSDLVYKDALDFPDGIYLWISEVKFRVYIFHNQMIVLN